MNFDFLLKLLLLLYQNLF